MTNKIVRVWGGPTRWRFIEVWSEGQISINNDYLSATENFPEIESVA